MTYLPTVYRQTAREVSFVLVVGLMNGFWYIYVYVTAGSHFGKLKSVRSQFVDTTYRKEKAILVDIFSFQTQVIVISAYLTEVILVAIQTHIAKTSVFVLICSSISPTTTSLFPSIIVKSRLEKLFDTPI